MTGTILTSKGLRLITKVLASSLPLAFSRVAVGTGTFPEGYNPFYAIGLNKYKMDGEISGTYSNGEEATIIFQIGAQPIEESFIITEVGLFAQDPDEGEVLYAYLNLSSSPEYVYATNGTVQKLVEIEFKTIIGEVEHVSVITSPNALVTKEEFKQELQKKISHDGGDISETISQFEDYTRENSTPLDARTAISRIVSGIKHSKFVEYTKAALMGLVTIGEMRGLLVNHGLCTEPGKFFLDAAYGKYLTDQITQLNSDVVLWSGELTFEENKVITLNDNISKYKYINIYVNYGGDCPIFAFLSTNRYFEMKIYNMGNNLTSISLWVEEIKLYKESDTTLKIDNDSWINWFWSGHSTDSATKSRTFASIYKIVGRMV